MSQPERRTICPDCGCNCPVCRYRHRSPDVLLSHAVRCDSVERRPLMADVVDLDS